MTDDRNPMLELARGAARRKARQLARRSAVWPMDRDDLEQELLLAVLARLSRYDPGRTTPKRFVTLVVRHAVADLLRSREARKRSGRAGSLSRRVWTDEGVCELASLLTTDREDGRRGVHPRPDDEAAQLRADVGAVLARLPGPLRDLARRLMSATAAQVARDLGISRRALTTPMRQLRAAFERAGLAEYLEKRGAPPERFA